MKSFGTILKEAREAKGLTTSQVAHDTHMLVQIVEEMEREDFHRIPAPIYGRGFVRLYAERVGLDPAPLITEFMEIFNGHKKPVPSQPPMPPPAPAPEPPPAVEPPPVEEPQPSTEPPPAVEPLPAVETPPAVESSPAVEPPPTIDTTTAFTQPPAPEPTPANPATNLNPAPSRAVSDEIPPSLRGLDLFDPSAAESRPPVPPPPSVPPRSPDWESPFAGAYSDADEESSGNNAAQRFRDGLSVVSHGVLGTVRQIPRNAWRIALLALGGILILALVIWGCRALYKATSSTTEPAIAAPAPAPNEAKPAQPAPSKAKPAQPAPSKAKPAQSAPSKAKPAGKQAPSPSQPAAGSLKSTGIKVEPLYID